MPLQARSSPQAHGHQLIRRKARLAIDGLAAG
jgi:hypothetical protein